MNFKNIHIGSMINQRVVEKNMEISRLCIFLKCREEEIEKMYHAKTLDSEMLLRWSKLLDYDFFRIYTQHLILYAPMSSGLKQNEVVEQSTLPRFRKNVYTKEIIEFILEVLSTGKKTKLEVIREYGIPKTTLYKWINKYKS